METADKSTCSVNVKKIDFIKFKRPKGERYIYFDAAVIDQEETIKAYLSRLEQGTSSTSQPPVAIGPKKRLERLKIVAENIRMFRPHKLGNYDEGVRILSVDEDSILHPVIEPGMIVYGSKGTTDENGDWLGLPLVMRSIEDIEEFVNRSHRMGLNNLVAFAIFAPREDVSHETALSSDYVALTETRTGRYCKEPFKVKDDCPAIFLRDCGKF